MVQFTSAARTPVLVVDPEREFLESLKSVGSPDPLVARTGIQAQTILADPSLAVSAIFVNPAISMPYGVSVLRFAHLRRAGTPLFLIHDGEGVPFSDRELRGLGVQKSFKKPVSYEMLRSLVEPIVQGFNADHALDSAQTAQKSSEKVNVEFAMRDAEFVPILAGNFLSGHRSYFDVYIRLGNGRYLKLIEAGESFSADRLENYLRKGVKQFFLKKEAQATYLSYCDHLAAALVHRRAGPADIRLGQVLNLGQETLSFLSRQGVNSQSLEQASRFVLTTRKLLSQGGFGASPEIARLLLDLESYQHGVAVTMVASLICQAMGLSSERIDRMVGVSALLHDVALQGVIAPELELKPENMSEAELRIWKAHARTGAAILERVQGVDPGVVLAVAQHHDRRNRSGISGRASSPTGIFPIAEIIGISDELVSLIHQAAQDPCVRPLKVMADQVFDGFSFAVIEGFRKAFISIGGH